MNTIVENHMDPSLFEPYKISCGKCSGLCCVALYFAKTDGFPRDKEAGTACKNLQKDCRCKVHSKLYEQGLKGCMNYDCFGAGQYVTGKLQVLPDWLAIPSGEAELIFNAYLAVMRVHQTLWYLTQCLVLRLHGSEKEQAENLIAEGRKSIETPSEILAVFDPQPFCEKSNQYLKHICRLCKSYYSNAEKTQPSNYMGKNMRQKNLAGKDFSMSLLIAADLEQATLHGANFLGADMRDTNVRNTDLSQCLFLTQIQINAAKGNRKTVLPPYLCRPEIWD